MLGDHESAAAVADRESAERLAEVHDRQADVDRISRRLAELGARNHFAEAIEAALAARRRR